ncbi:MAG: PTS IIA-like nitrogen regulatory protein PtsN [Alphaproteobacteria bacterium]
MKITDMINEDCFVVNIRPQNKRSLLETLADVASKQTKVDKRIIFDALLERENLGSTGFGNRTAIPHARIPDINKVYAFFVALDNPIDFQSVDNAPVDLMFLLLSPENNGADHLTALASISRVLKDENLCNKLRNAKQNIELHAILKNVDEAC